MIELIVSILGFVFFICAWKAYKNGDVDKEDLLLFLITEDDLRGDE